MGKVFAHCRVDLHKDPIDASISDILNYFGDLFSQKKSFSVINTAKVAISHYLHFPPYKYLSDHPAVDKFFTGLFNLQPPKPKISTIWDVNTVFTHISSWGSNAVITDRQLTQKLAFLLLLLGGQRVNTIFNFHTDRMIFSTTSVTFAPATVLKHSRKGSKLNSFTYRAYPQDNNLCVVECLKEYLSRRESKIAGSVTNLFVTYGKPYKAASIDTVRRWVKDLFNECNINFSPHSCRSASTSKALDCGVNLSDILTKGCWKNCKTFMNFYKKDIVQESEVDFNVIVCDENNKN